MDRRFRLVNPTLWNEGVWTNVTREIHRDLMNNQSVRRYAPMNKKD